MAVPTKTKSVFRGRRPWTDIVKGISSQSIPQQKDLSIADMLPRPGETIARSPSVHSKSYPLSILPLSTVLRSFAITSASCSPVLLGPCLKFISILAHTKSPLLSLDKNEVLNRILKKTIYRQFCAGENEAEVKPMIAGLKSMGFKGVMLAYAREIVIDQNSKDNLSDGEAQRQSVTDIQSWKEGTIATIKMASPSDFVALKFTGAGSQAVDALLHERHLPAAVELATDAICDSAAIHGIRLLFDAEQAALQPTIDTWTVDYMRRYNRAGKALVYGTYQAYLKACPTVLASHMAIARKESFTLGVKLVRGAYLGNDPRYLIHDTKADTDTAYDSIAESLATLSYGSVLQPAAGDDSAHLPRVDVVLAGHNRASVHKIQALRKAQVERQEPCIDLVYAQLQGMADELSCELVQEGVAQLEATADAPQAYKYLVWGTTGECLKFLLRRAQENKDALQRTKDTRDAMAAEIVRRVRMAFGLGASHLTRNDVL